MKIVHVEDFIHPDAGYQVNMLARLQVLEGHHVDIVTAELNKIPDFLTVFFGKNDIQSKDNRFFCETGAKIYRVPLHGFYSGRAIFHVFKLFAQVRRLKPDVVFVHGEDTLTGIMFIALSRFLPYPIVLDCHMLEMASENPLREYFRAFYRRFITPIILKRKIPFIRVVDSDFVQKCLGIPLSATKFLSLGTDTDHFRPDTNVRLKVREELGLLPNAFVVIYAGKLDEYKGGKFFSEALLEGFHVEGDRPIQFLIIGNIVGEYGKVVEANFLASKNYIVRLPTQRYFDLARYYQAADVSVFPRQCSMSFFEAQSCGLPVLFENNEVNNQRVSRNNAFTFIPGSVDNFRAQIEKLAGLPQNILNEYSINARDYILQNYNFVPISKQYTDVLFGAVKEWHKI